MHLPEAFRRMGQAAEVARFYTSWATACAAGIPHLKAMEIVLSDGAGRAGRRRAKRLLPTTRAGKPLSDGARAPDFGPLERALIQLGEERGCLEEELHELAAFHRADHLVALKVRSRLAYPLAVALAGCLILPLPLLFMGPASAYCLAVGVGLFLVIQGGGAIAWACFEWERGRPRWAMARLCRVLATAMETAMPLDSALSVAAEVVAPSKLAAAIEAIPRADRLTQPLSTSLNSTGYLPPALASTLQTAEQTGETVGTLRHLADLYEAGVF